MPSGAAMRRRSEFGAAAWPPSVTLSARVTAVSAEEETVAERARIAADRTVDADRRIGRQARRAVAGAETAAVEVGHALVAARQLRTGRAGVCARRGGRAGRRRRRAGGARRDRGSGSRGGARGRNGGRRALAAVVV